MISYAQENEQLFYSEIFLSFFFPLCVIFSKEDVFNSFRQLSIFVCVDEEHS